MSFQLFRSFGVTIIVPYESVKLMLKNFLEEAAEPKIVPALTLAAVPGDVPASDAALSGDDLIPAVDALLGDTIVVVSDASGTKSAYNSSSNTIQTRSDNDEYIESGDRVYVWPISDDEGAEYSYANLESEGDGDGFYHSYEEE
ncbi:hypothetical protein OROGR_022349 [Orobanche gracilis]